ncbi:MAG: hypothetical protein RL143_1207 [Pseudomonadota bacterium]
MSAPKLIMLDLDGTLVDSVPDLYQALNRMMADLGREPVVEAEVRNWVGNGVQVLVARALAGAINYLDDAMDQPIYQKALDSFSGHYDQTNGHFAKLYPGVASSLKRWSEQGIELGVVTNKPIRFTLPLLERLGIAPFVSHVVGGDTLPVKKPDPGQLFYLMEQAGSVVAQTLMIGDSKHDIHAARAAGVTVYAVSYGYNHGEPIELSEPDKVFDSLDELLFEA